MMGHKNLSVLCWFVSVVFEVNSINAEDQKKNISYFVGNSATHSFERHGDKVFYKKSPLLENNDKIFGSEIVIEHPFTGTTVDNFFDVDVDEVVVNKWRETGFVLCFTYQNKGQCCLSWIANLDGIYRGGKIDVPDNDLYYLPVGVYTVGDSDIMNVMLLGYDNEKRNGTPRQLLYVNNCVASTQVTEDSGKWYPLRIGDPIKYSDSIE